MESCAGEYTRVSTVIGAVAGFVVVDLDPPEDLVLELTRGGSAGADWAVPDSDHTKASEPINAARALMVVPSEGGANVNAARVEERTDGGGKSQ